MLQAQISKYVPEELHRTKKETRQMMSSNNIQDDETVSCSFQVLVPNSFCQFILQNCSLQEASNILHF